MAYLIQKYGNVGENPDFGGSGTSWVNPENALIYDASVASTTFTSTNLTSNYLYIHDFLMGLNSSDIITGIEVTVKKRGIGAVVDNYIGLVYGPVNSLNTTTPNKATTEVWANLNTTVTYGGPTDLWGKTWTYDELDSPQFGIVISATGDGVGYNGAEIDYVRVDVYYTSSNVYNGFWGKGSATVQCKYKAYTSRRAPLLSGHFGLIFDNDTSGGIISGGSIDLPEVINGGFSVNGSAVVNVVYGEAKTNYEFYATGQKEIPPDTQHPNALAVSYLSLNGNVFSGKIKHNITSPNVVRFRGPASSTEIAGTTIAIDGSFTIAPTIRFSTTLTPTQVTEVLNGQWYLYMLESSTGTHIRGQVQNLSTQLNGSAIVTTFIELGGGGVFSNGNAVVVPINTIVGSGGMFVSGSANFYGSSNIRPQTGCSIGRGISADVKFTIFPTIVSKGLLVNGRSFCQTTYSPLIDDYGPIAYGQIPTAITTTVGNEISVELNGSALVVKINVLYPIGAISSNGYHVLRQTYASQPLEGGIRIIGSWAGEKIKPLISSSHINYALVMNSPNILNSPKANNCVDSPAKIKSNRFKIYHQPGYCSFGNKCDAAYLPEIVKKRQGKYLPIESDMVVYDSQIDTTAQLQ